ncbi:MAG: RNA-guided endonuclease TnpB family protein, partial [Bacteroidia bacterium]
MDVVKTTKSKILLGDEDMKNTIEVFRTALTHMITVVFNNWGTVAKGSTSQLKQQIVERLLIPTKTRIVLPENDLSAKFHKLPSYFRRALITEAIGTVSSHMSRMDNWREAKSEIEAKGKKFYSKPPTLQYEPKSYPTFYFKNMFLGEPENFVGKKELSLKIKVYRNNDWVWKNISVDAKSLQKRGLSVYEPMAPTVIKSHGGYFLHIPWQRKINLPDIKTSVDGLLVCSVDSNLGNDAVAAIIDSNGTVLARKFISFPREKDLMIQAIDRISKANRLSGIGSKPNLWRRVNNLKTEIVNRTVKTVVDFALEFGCHLIVTENLKSLKPNGSRREKIHHWRIMEIHRRLEVAAHHNGMRYSKVNPCNTSKLAFDGTGVAARPGKGKLLTFTTGKVYSADLNAAYNIGARWFVREMYNRLPKKHQAELRAKAPALYPGSGTTLDTLK